MTRPSMAVLVRKEARALWPVWAATAGVCLAAGLVNHPRWMMPSYLAYFMGSVALAALAIGHEYTHGTLPALLSLPVDRRRLLFAKLLAVVPMLVTLGLLALAIAPRTRTSERAIVDVALSLLTAASVAPWLTMLCRSPLAGSVFALGVAGGLHLVSLGVVIVYVKLGGLPGMPLQIFGDRILAGLLIVSAAGGAIGGWRRFMTLEAIDGRGTDLTWPRWLRSSMALDEERLVALPKRGHPYWLLVKKELRLQQISIAVAAINVLFWAAAWFVVDRSPADYAVLASVGVMYGGLLAVLIGAVASASERHMGTHAWQQLLPVSAWRQWLVKTVVILSLTLALAFGLPLLLATGNLPITGLHAGGVVMLTIGGLFVSSLCGSPLQAITIAAPGLLVAASLLGWSLEFAAAGRDAAIAIAIGLAAIGWWQAFVNHRTAR